jgi:hypothetical protein
MANLRDIMDSLQVGVRGFGQGVTAGTIQYPQAAVMAGQRAADGAPDVRAMQQTRRGAAPRQGYFVGGDSQATPTFHPDIQFRQALAALRADNEAIKSKNPAAWYGGNLVGGATLAAATGGTSLPGMVGANAGIGAVSGFTENEDLGDAAIGGTVGAGLGAAGNLIGRGVGAVSNAVARNNIVEKVSTLLTEKPKGYITKLRKITGVTRADEKAGISRDVRTEAADMVKALREKEVRPSDIDMLANQALTELSTPFKQHAANVIAAGKAAIPGSLGGLGATTAINYLSNGTVDIHPLVGAGLGGMYSAKLAAGQALGEIGRDVTTRAAINEWGKKAFPAAVRATTLAAVPATMAVRDAISRTKEVEPEFDPWDAPTAPKTQDKDPWE